jgi:ATP-dependent DNA helicase RecG
VNRDKLAPILAELTTLPGVGPTLAALLAKAAGGPRVLDLLFHLPQAYVDRRERPTIRTARPGQVATLAVEVVRLEAPATLRQPWRVVVGDGTGFAELVFFKRHPVLDRLRPGMRVLASGKVDSFGDRLSMVHPDHLVPADKPARLPEVEPVWPLTAGLSAWQVRKAMAGALQLLPNLPEWHDPPLLRREQWPGFAVALRALQAPAELPAPLPRARLAYDELLANQLALALVRERRRARAGRSLPGDGRLRGQALARFGHEPTPSQAAALDEIDADLAAPSRMLRLLQGDVGSGKTLVAALAMLRAVEAGTQAALMAPTEVLAHQHHATLSRFVPVPVALLTGAVKGAPRRRVLAGLADGSVPIVVGTHALFQPGVTFRDLGLAVIDEQHRFGVDQRLLLGAKGERTDVLVMTATPIPRTLVMTQWGDMAVSRLTEKPAGRLPVRTTLHSLSNLPELADAVARALDGGAQIYWVCPLVAESEVVDIAAAEARFADLRARFGPAIGLVHGQQEPAARERTLAAFAAGRIRLLVATTVVEVGVDVPQANVMVIEHAERFGLAQLHQLRGRVGRSTAQSFCLLLHDDVLPEPSRRRLTLLRDTENGFTIADEDFRARGGGDVLGTRQSGAPEFRLADPVQHEALLHMAHRDAAVLLANDPELKSPRGHAVRLLLQLFRRPEGARALLSG